MDSDSEMEQICTPPEIRQIATDTCLDLLPQKSKKKYENTYRVFMDWRDKKQITSFSENILIAYFVELGDKYKASSLWATYSMLRSTLNIKKSVNIAEYCKLRAFLKKKSDEYQAKKAKTFTTEEVKKFIDEAPDGIYLATKVAMIMGIMGACRANELHAMVNDDLQDLGSAYLVIVPKTKTNCIRKFTITDKYYTLVKKYAMLKPTNIDSKSFFLNYQKGKCTSQNIGINKFGSMGKDIAKYLRLPHPHEYTGHCFRRSSATILVDAGGNMTALKRHGGWKSTTVAEGYIDDSIKNKMDTSSKIYESVNQPSTSKFTQKSSTINENINVDAKPTFTLNNCANVKFT